MKKGGLRKDGRSHIARKSKNAAVFDDDERKLFMDVYI
jgi:hypothetical protein